MGIVLADLALSSSTRPLWTTVIRGVVLESVLTGLQYYQARKALTDRLRRLRDEIFADTSPPGRLTFQRPRGALWGEILALVVFGVFASIAIYTSQVWIALGLAFCFVAAFASLVLRGQLGITLSADSIEGLMIVGRARIRYADVDRIQELSFPHVTIVVSSLGTIWIPSSLKDYDQPLDVLWDRVVRPPIGADPPSFQRESPAAGAFDASQRVDRRNALFALPRHRCGRAAVLDARLRKKSSAPPPVPVAPASDDARPRRPGSHRQRGSGTGSSAAVRSRVRWLRTGTLGPGLRFEGAPALLEEIADRIWRSGRHEEDRVVDAVESFNQRFDEEDRFPCRWRCRTRSRVAIAFCARAS